MTVPPLDVSAEPVRLWRLWVVHGYGPSPGDANYIATSKEAASRYVATLDKSERATIEDHYVNGGYSGGDVFVAYYLLARDGIGQFRGLFATYEEAERAINDGGHVEQQLVHS